MSRARPLAIAALVATALLATKSSAQVKKPITLSVAAGLSAPTGDFGDTYNSGFNILGAVNFQQSPSPLSLRIDGSYNQFDRKSSLAGSSTAKIWALTGNVVITPSNVLGPYLLGGLGLYSSDFGGGSSSDLGLNLGAGYRFSLSGFDAFLEARWHKITDSSVQFIPLSFGVTF